MLTLENYVQQVLEIEIDFGLYRHTYSKNVSMIVFPMDIAKVERAVMYVEINAYRHPVIVNDNHFTLPKKLQQIVEKEGCEPQKIRLSSIISEDGYYFLGLFTKGKESYSLTVDKKIREILRLKERDIIEIQVKNNIFYSRTWWRSNKKSMVSFFPGKIFGMRGLKPGIPYQIKIKKSERTFVSNDLEVYISCLKTLGIPTNDIKIYVNLHEKTEKFIKEASKYGIVIKVHKKGSKGFGGVINIFKFRSFKKLAHFNPFLPNEMNAEKFISSFNKIDRNRVRFL